MIPALTVVPLIDRLHRAEQALAAAARDLGTSGEPSPLAALTWLQAASDVAVAGENLDRAVPGSLHAATTAGSRSYAAYAAGLLGLALT